MRTLRFTAAPVCPTGEHSHQYFAYGSNLDPEQVLKRSPGARFVTRAALPGYKLVFDIFSNARQVTTADIAQVPGEEVMGVVYEMSHQDMLRMDTFEERSSRIACQVYPIDHKGTVRPDEAVMVETYEAYDKSSTAPTSKAYLDILLKGARFWNLPQSWIDKLNRLREEAI